MLGLLPVVAALDSATIIGDITSTGATVLSWITTQLGSLFTFMVGQPLIMLGIYIAAAGLVINFGLRLVKSFF